MRPKFSPFFALALVPALYVCAVPALGQGDPGGPAVSGDSTQGEPIPQRLTLPSAKTDGVVTTDRANYRPGQPIAIVFTITNTSGNPVHYDYPSDQQSDVTVSDSLGHPVWDEAQGRKYSQRITTLLLKPGQKKTYTAVWNGRTAQGRPVPAGVYTISARMTSSDRPAITGSFAVNTDTDPENFGSPTRSPSDNGAVRQVFPNPPITAAATVTIGGPAPSSK